MEIYRSFGTVQYLRDIPCALSRSTPLETFKFAACDGRGFSRQLRPHKTLRGFKDEITKIGEFGKFLVCLPLKDPARFCITRETQDTHLALRTMNGQCDTGAQAVSARLFIHFLLLPERKDIR